MDLELRQILTLTRRWWWLLLLVPVVAGSTARYVVSRSDPLYAASSTVLVNAGESTALLDMGLIQSSRSITETFRELIRTPLILAPVVDALGLPYGADSLQAKVTVSPIGETSFLTISVSDTDPQRAASIANEIAIQFAAYVEAQAIEEDSPARIDLGAEIAETRQRIEENEAQVLELQRSPNAEDEAVKQEVAALNRFLDQLYASYTRLLLTEQQVATSLATSQARVEFVREAAAPGAPYAPRVTVFTLAAGLAGIVLAVVAVGLLEYLDNAVKVGRDFVALVGAPLLSVITTAPKLRPGRDQAIVLERPRSTTAEAIRLLRTNVEFAAASREIRTLVVTSPGPGEGKSTITANLGTAMAQAGYTTVIVDADLRRPSQHRIFGLANERGLSTLLARPERTWQEVAGQVGTPNLLVIPSGPLPPNPADLLSSDRLRHLLAEIGQTADIVLVDTPPILAVSDPLVVATHTDGVALVCRAGRTRVESLRRAAEALEQGNVRLVGVVLNQQPEQDLGDYYYYTGYYSSSSNGSTPNTPEDKPVGARTGRAVARLRRGRSAS